MKEGPYYICVVCNRCMYKRTVKPFKQSKYRIDCDIFTMIKSFDKNWYICVTCEKHVTKNQIPCQAVGNKLLVDILPDEISSLKPS